jgi:hypothetical protein
MRLRPITIFAIVLTLLFPTTLFAANPKAGAKCSKAGLTQVYSGKKFTCVKTGKNLFWNSGIPISKSNQKPIPSPSPTPSPSKGMTLEEANKLRISLDPLSDKSCSKENERIPNLQGELICLFWNGGPLKWVQNWLPPIGPTPTPSQSSSQNDTPAVGGNCAALGERVAVSGVELECRYVTGPKLNWIKVKDPNAKFITVSNPNGVKPCQLEAPVVGNGYVGFPVSLTRNAMPSKGVNHVLIAPIDFSDYVGEKDLASILKYQSDGLKNWVDYFSDGKLKFDIKTINHWVRAPQKAAFYSRTEGDNRGIDGNKKLAAIAQEYIDFLTNEIDLTGIATVYILYPENMGVNETDLVPRTTQFKTKEGERVMSVFARSKYDWGEQTPQWVMWIHESGHDWGLLGHTPGNGWRFNIMTNQSGDSAVLSAWERFLLDWMPTDSVYCNTKSNLTNVTLSLSALEIDDKKTKMVAITLDSKRVLVIESHAIGRWSEVFTKNKFPQGFYGVLAYVVDTSYTGETIYVGPQGESLPEDFGNDPRFPRYAYYEPIYGIDLKSRHTYGLSNFPDGTSSDAYTALVGDSFLIDGIRIKVLSTGDFETIQITKE